MSFLSSLVSLVKAGAKYALSLTTDLSTAEGQIVSSVTGNPILEAAASAATQGVVAVLQAHGVANVETVASDVLHTVSAVQAKVPTVLQDVSNVADVVSSITSVKPTISSIVGAIGSAETLASDASALVDSVIHKDATPAAPVAGTPATE